MPFPKGYLHRLIQRVCIFRKKNDTGPDPETLYLVGFWASGEARGLQLLYYIQRGVKLAGLWLLSPPLDAGLVAYDMHIKKYLTYIL